MNEKNFSGDQLEAGDMKSLGITILGLFVVIHMMHAFSGQIDIMGGELLGTDGYTRLNRVQFIYEQGTWNNSIYPRSNAPYGESIHWTKPLDLILLAGGIGLSIFVPFSTGLHAWGVVMSPVLHLVAFAGLLCVLRQRVDRLGIILLVILFLVQPILTGYFAIGRPDHHSLILAIFSWFIVGLDWGLQRSRHVRHLMFTGCMGALGLWVSVEFLVAIGVFLTGYTLVWIWKGKEKMYPVLMIMSSMFVLSALFLFLERLGEDHFLIEYDRISLAHVTVLGLILVVWAAIALISRKTTWLSTRGGRTGIIGLGSIIACLVQWSLFPGFFQGPLAGMDPAFRQLIWNVSETQSLTSSQAIMNVGIGILALPLLAMSLWREHTMLRKYQGLLLVIGAGMFIPLALYEARWTPYASIVLLIPYVVYARRALEWVGTRWPNRRGEAASFIAGLVLLFWPITVGVVMALDEPQREQSTIGGKCPLKPLGEYLTTRESWAGQTILTFKDFGPELLYRTSHQVIATPMHRNREGIRDMLAIMKAEESDAAASVIRRRKIELILLCVNLQAVAEVYRSSLGKVTFYENLLEGELPTWLTEVILPEKLQESFRLFEVVKSELSQDS